MNYFKNRRNQNYTKMKVFEGMGGSGKDSIRIIPLGGSGNVTKNMYLYEYRYDNVVKDILIVDCGIGFPDAEMYGVDLVIPDVRYLSDKKNLIRGLIFSHGHDDHIGGIAYLYPKLGNIRMYGSKLTAAFANIKLKEIRIDARVESLDYGQIINLGVFKIYLIRVTHSVPDTAHVVIETPIGIFYHGSDFKFDMTPLDDKTAQIDMINRVGSRKPLCLLTDCLGSERVGFTPSEKGIADTISREMKLCHGKFLFTTQSSNILRIQMAIEIAISNGRNVALLGRSINQNVDAAVKMGYMKIPREMIVRDRDLKKIPASKQCVIIAGSQGQQGSALSRVANDLHTYVHLKEGDTVMISADPIPGNEIIVSTLIDQLYRRGARVSYTDIMEDLHVSGHGHQGDLMYLLSMLGPSYVFPIGGTYRHIMQYRRLAIELGYRKENILVPEEGEVIEFKPGRSPVIVDKLNLENIMIDGLGIGDVGKIVLRDRQTIAKEGIMVIIVPIESMSGKITADPDIITRGFVYVRESGKLIDETRKLVLKALKLKKGRVINWQFVRKNVEETIGAFLYKETGRSPLIVPVIVEV
jgi:ribonuclease J